MFLVAGRPKKPLEGFVTPVGSRSIVERLCWRATAEGWYRLPGSREEHSYQEADEAQSDAVEREWAVRRIVNPFRCGGPRLHYQTAFDPPRLCDWCLDHGIDPPGPTSESADWAAWWDVQSAAFTDRQRVLVWDVLDRVRFYRVRSMPVGVPTRLISLPRHEEDPISPGDSYGRQMYVGGSPYMMAGSMDTAERICRAVYDDHWIRQGMRGEANPSEVSFVREQSEAFAEPQAVEWPIPANFDVDHVPCTLYGTQPRPGQTLFAVIRLHWRLDRETAYRRPGSAPSSYEWRWHATHADSCGYPVGAYDTLEDADLEVARLDREARAALVSPFRFGSAHEWSDLHPSEIWGVLSNLAPINFTHMLNDYYATDSLWIRWWDSVVPGLTDAQIDVAWSLFDRLRFHEVVEVEFRD